MLLHSAYRKIKTSLEILLSITTPSVPITLKSEIMEEFILLIFHAILFVQLK